MISRKWHFDYVTLGRTFTFGGFDYYIDRIVVGD